MNRRPSRPLPGVAAAVLLSVMVAACQGNGAGSPSAAGGEGPEGPLLEVTQGGELGARVVDADGRSLYVFLDDSPGESACSGGCAESWPPATVGEGASLQAGERVTGEVGTIEREDGTLQLTLEGWPLYRYAADGAPGDATGEGVGGVWFVARPDGSLPAASASPGASAAASEEASAEPSADDSGSYDPYDY
jgi:predicted lipoprotein with Yx(FWY)xxD motif